MSGPSAWPLEIHPSSTRACHFYDYQMRKVKEDAKLNGKI
jgi:hypothetical protein